MAGGPGELKARIEEFIRITGADYEDQTDRVRQKSSVIEWQFRVGRKVVISKNRNRDDRVHLSVTMVFPPGDARLFEVRNPSFSKAVMEISEICTVCGVGHQWIRDGDGGRDAGGGDDGSGAMAGLSMTAHVDVEALGRATFHDAWANLARVSSHVQKILHSRLSGSLRPQDAVPPDGAQEKSMYG